jgi:hypothetical protein
MISNDQVFGLSNVDLLTFSQSLFCLNNSQIRIHKFPVNRCRKIRPKPLYSGTFGGLKLHQIHSKLQISL